MLQTTLEQLWNERIAKTEQKLSSNLEEETSVSNNKEEQINYNFGVYYLTPLGQEDVALAATQNGLDSKAFWNEVNRKEVIALAGQPATLKILFEEYRESKEFSQTQAELYLKVVVECARK